MEVLEQQTDGVDRAAQEEDRGRWAFERRRYCGRSDWAEALLEELEAEWIAYTPEELVQIGEGGSNGVSGDGKGEQGIRVQVFSRRFGAREEHLRGAREQIHVSARYPSANS